MYFHHQLFEKGILHGRCWWCLGRDGCSPSRQRREVRLEWSFGQLNFGFGFEWGDEWLTLHARIPLVSLFLSFSLGFWLIGKLAPRRALDPIRYPNVIVVDERRCEISICDWILWFNPWSKSNERVAADPWWVRGLSFHLNPFRLEHYGTWVRTASGEWVERVDPWDGTQNRPPDAREVQELPYRYTLKCGKVQERVAKVHMQRMVWMRRNLKWAYEKFGLAIFAKERTAIEVEFDGEVGERSGSWKGGVIGCGYEVLPGESAESCLRRMERERKF